MVGFALGGVASMMTKTAQEAINRATGGTQARNNYMFETVYCWSGIGTAKVYGMGHFDTATNLSNALSSIILTASAGTISGTYSTQHSY